MTDYTFVTDEDFDNRLAEKLDEMSGYAILTIDGVYEHIKEYLNNEVLEEWERDNPVLAHPPIIFDNGGETCDRYTVFPQHGEFEGNRTHYLGCSEGGRAISQWGEMPPTTAGSLDHLGRRVTLVELDTETRNHIIARLGKEY